MAPPGRKAAGRTTSPTAVQIRDFLLQGAMYGPQRAVRLSDGIDAKPAWRCRFSDCPFAKACRINFGHRDTCKGCSRPKQHAMNPPRSLACPPTEPTTSVNKGNRRSTTDGNRAPQQAEAAPPGKTATPNQTPKANKPSDKDPTEPGLIGTTFAHLHPPKCGSKYDPNKNDLEVLGLHELRDIEPETLYSKPMLRPPPLHTPEELVAAAAPFEASEALAAKQAELALTRQILSLVGEANPAIKASALAALEEQEAAVAKLAKKAPGSRLQIEQLRSAKQSQAEAAVKWEQVIAEGRGKAVQRMEQHLKIIDGLSEQLVKRRKMVVAAFQSADQAWAQHHQVRRDQWAALHREFDNKITELELAPVAASLEDNRMQDIAQQGPTDPVASAQQDTARAMDVLAAAQSAVRQAADDQAAAERAAALLKAANPQLARFDCSLDELPSSLPEPQPEQWQLLHNLCTALQLLYQHEAADGDPIPVTFDQLQAGIDVPRMLLGEDIWNRAFPHGQPKGDVVLTVQLKKLLGISLDHHREKLVADKARQESAAVSAAPVIEEAAQQFKKRRRDALQSPGVASG